MFPNLPDFSGIQPALDFIGGTFQFIVAHPILTIAGGLTATFFSLGLFQAIAEYSKNFWGWVLDSSANMVKFTCKMTAMGLKALAIKGVNAAKNTGKQEEK